MFSFFGWTPSLRRMLRGRILPCGCSVGVYETHSGEVVCIVDARATSCDLVTHSVDAVVTPDDVVDDEPAHAPGDAASTLH